MITLMIILKKHPYDRMIISKILDVKFALTKFKIMIVIHNK